MNVLTLKQTISRGALILSKHIPDFLFFVGLASGIAATTSAITKSKKSSEIIEKHKSELEILKNAKENEEKYSDEDYRKDIVDVYKNTGKNLLKLYWPTITFTALSVTSILSSHNILKHRNVALMAAYGALQREFDSYKETVVNTFGEDREAELRQKSVLHNTPVEVDEEGKEISTHHNDHSIYSRIFDELNDNWSRSKENNVIFLKTVQNNMNDLLKIRGHLFLNEVYSALGFPHTSAGSVVGWTTEGGGYIDFGLFNRTDSTFINGWNESVILDFNVDGVIYDLLGDRKH